MIESVKNRQLGKQKRPASVTQLDRNKANVCHNLFTEKKVTHLFMKYSDCISFIIFYFVERCSEVTVSLGYCNHPAATYQKDTLDYIGGNIIFRELCLLQFQLVYTVIKPALTQ